MKKTVLLSIDLLFALILLLSFVFIVESVKIRENFNNKLLHTYAKDALLYMDESLRTKRELLIYRDLDKYLPTIIAYQITVDFYDTTNKIVKSITFGSDLPLDYAVVTRVFDYANSYGVANLKVWLGNRHGTGESPGAVTRFNFYPSPAWYIDKSGNILDAVPQLMEDDGVYIQLRGESPGANEYLVNLTYETPFTEITSVKFVSKYFMTKNSDPAGGNVTLSVWNNLGYVFYADTEMNNSCLTEILDTWVVDTCNLTNAVVDPKLIIVQYNMIHSVSPRIYERRIDYAWIEIEGYI